MYNKKEKREIFSTRLRTMMNLLGKRNKDIVELSRSGEGIEIIEELISRWKNGKSMPTKENREYLASLLGIDPKVFNINSNPSHNPNLYYFMELCKIKNPDTYINEENFEDNSIEFDEYCKQERLELLTKIIPENYKLLETLDLYILNDYYDTYKLINESAWSVLCIYNLVNSSGKNKINEFLSQQSNILETLSNDFEIISNIVNPLIKIRDTNLKDIEELYKAQLLSSTEEELCDNIISDLNHKLQKESYDIIEKFSRQMQVIATMDKFDCNILIQYYLLSDKMIVSNEDSEKQYLLLDFAEKIYCDDKYSNSTNSLD